jgi:hypothetical protein
VLEFRVALLAGTDFLIAKVLVLVTVRPYKRLTYLEWLGSVVITTIVITEPA